MPMKKHTILAHYMHPFCVTVDLAQALIQEFLLGGGGGWVCPGPTDRKKADNIYFSPKKPIVIFQGGGSRPPAPPLWVHASPLILRSSLDSGLA